MSDEQITKISDVNSRLRFTLQADGVMTMRIVGDTGNEYVLSGREHDCSDVECSCPGWQRWGRCYHVSSLRARVAGEPVAERPAQRARRRRRPSARRIH